LAIFSAPRLLIPITSPPRSRWGDHQHDEPRPAYDLRQLLKRGVRGKYAKRCHAGTNLVLLDPEVRKAFASESAVNEALRLVIELRKIGSARGRSN